MEIIELEIEKIVVENNPRKDFGDIGELTASIREFGIRSPLWVTKDNKLIAGERRLRVASDLGLKTVPVQVVDESDETVAELRLVENIQRKELNPLEEGEAFQNYIKTTKHSKEHLAKKIGKAESYIDRRLALTDLSKPARKAFADGKIKLGHAVVLARLDKQKQAEKVKEIIDSDVSVDEFIEYLDDDNYEQLDSAKFDLVTCSGCKYNGGEQTLLIDTGKNMKDICLRPECFHKKTADWITGRIEVFREKGWNYIPYDQIKQIKGAHHIGTYHQEYKDAQKNLATDHETYAITISNEYDYIDEQIWRIKPHERKDDPVSHVESKKHSDKRLSEGAEELRRDILVRETAELIRPSTKQAKALILWAAMCKDGHPGNNDIIRGKVSYLDSDMMQKLVELPDEELDSLMLGAAINYLDEMWEYHQWGIAGACGFDMSKSFEITQEFLELHTKDQLLSLAEELDCTVKKTGARGQLIADILSNDTKGKVPKIMAQTVQPKKEALPDPDIQDDEDPEDDSEEEEE